MKRYTVVYLSSAEANLVAAWQVAKDRSAITAAADEADRVLAGAPTDTASLLGEGLWRLELGPLRFYYSVREEDRIVEICAVASKRV